MNTPTTGEKLNFLNYLAKYNKIFLLGGAIMMAGLFGLFYRQRNLAKQEAKAAEAIWAAQHYSEKKKYEEALHGDGIHPGLLSVIAMYGHTQSGNLARLYVAVIYMQKKNFEKALWHLKEFHISEDLFKARAWTLMGDAYCEQGNYPQAAIYYKKAANHKPNKFYTPLYLMKLASVYEKQKKYAPAYQAYQCIVDQFPDCSQHIDAQKHMGRLEVLQQNA